MKIHTIHMSVPEWIAIPDNPIQRDTERHAQKARRLHLKKYHETHAFVTAAVLPDGSMVKVDGHTRAFLWDNGELHPPEVVTATIYMVRDIDEAIELYRHFDNPAAAEDSVDRLFGAYRYHGITPKGYALTKGGVTSAMKLITGNGNCFDILSAVGDWKNELLRIDRIPFKKTNCTAWVIFAAMLTIRNHGEEAADFWTALANGDGSKVGREADGVHELERVIIETRIRRIGIGTAMLPQLSGKAIACCEAWINGQVYTNGVKGIDIYRYMQKMGLRKLDMTTRRTRASDALKAERDAKSRAKA